MAVPRHFLTGSGEPRALVVVFLRGGADGLSMVVPYEDDTYFRARPQIAVKKKTAIALSDLFGLNPHLKEIERCYRDGALAIIHAVGSEDATRSHFEAQDLMERGGEWTVGGWVGRFLRCVASDAGALSAVAIGTAVPESMRGAPAVTAMESFEAFSLGARATKLTAALGGLYALESNPLGLAGRETIDAMARIEQLRGRRYLPERGVEYAMDSFGRGLQEIARLIKARVGLTAACIDLEGWDSHSGQQWMIEPLMQRLAKGLSDFYRDLGSRMATTTVIVMTEFGRRVYENASQGTDHGRGSLMMVLGGGVRGGRVIANWPALTRDLLEGPGDLPVTTNYRNVLAPILARYGVREQLERIFPNFKLSPTELYP